MSKVQLLCILILFFMLFLPARSVYCTVDFKTDVLELTASENAQTIREWKLKPDKDKSEWVSLVTKDDFGTVLSSHLTVEGIDFSGQVMNQFSDEYGWSFNVLSPEGNIKLERIIKQTTTDYRLLCSVTISNLSGETIPLPDGIHIILGPGLGEYPENKFGIAEKLYSYVEPIISFDGKINLLAPETDAFVIDNLSNDTRSPFWGLNSRYFALLMKNESGHSPYSIFSRTIPGADPETLPSRYLPEIVLNYNATHLLPYGIFNTDFVIFSGPKSVNALSHDDNNYRYLLFYDLWNWMQIICFGLLWLLSKINLYLNSWGVSIIVLALLVRICIYPFASRVFSSQKKYIEVQKLIQPQIDVIKNKYKGGEQSEQILLLYKRYKVSPLAGLKPLTIVIFQIPIFIALFHVLGSAFELRDASFLWIKTLAEPDHLVSMPFSLPFFGSYFNLLPLLLAASTLITIKMAPAPTVNKNFFSTQNIFLIIMAIGFYILFYSFPSGMIIYWIMANLLHILQHKFSAIKNKNP